MAIEIMKMLKCLFIIEMRENAVDERRCFKQCPKTVFFRFVTHLTGVISAFRLTKLNFALVPIAVKLTVEILKAIS